MRFKTSLRAGQILTNNELMKEFSVANSGGMRKSNKNNVLVIISIQKVYMMINIMAMNCTIQVWD